MTMRSGALYRMGAAAIAVLLWTPRLAAHLPAIGLSWDQFNFNAAPGGPNPSPQYLTIANSTHGRMPWNAVTSAAWLSVSPSSGVLPGIAVVETVGVTISVLSTAMPAGTYSATITVSAPGDALSPPASNTPQTVNVTFTVANVQPPPLIALSTLGLSLSATTGSSTSPAGTVQISNAGGQPLAWTAAPDAGSANWLSVTPTAGVNTATITVATRVGSLTRGTYIGRINVSASGARNSPQAILVTLNISDPVPPSLRISQTSLSFSTVTQSQDPPSQQIAIDNGGEGALNWRATATTFNGGSWLTASPGSGSGPAVLTISPQLQTLAPGSYAGQVMVTADGALNSPVQVQVTFNVGRQKPVFSLNGLVSAANFTPGPLAPGEIASVFGSRLGPANGVALTLDSAASRLPSSLAGTQITFDGVAAPIFYTSASQVNFMVPFEVAGKTSARMTISVDGFDPVDLTVPIGDAQPGIFTVDGVHAAALNQDYTLNVAGNPAPAGSAVLLFLTGQGAVRPAIETGALAPTSPPFPEPKLSVSATLNGIAARVLFAGLAPGFAGLLQLNLEIPPGLAPSSQANVVVTIGSQSTLGPVTVAVK